MIETWQAPTADGTISEELLLSLDRGRERRVLILPALFDEANKLRRTSVEVMRRLDDAGCDCFLPDMPGCNESLVPLETQTLSGWRNAVNVAIGAFSATHILAVRGAALLAPKEFGGWLYAPQSGAKVLRAMIRARIIASRESGRQETSEALAAEGHSEGIVLAGWPIGAEMFAQLENAEPPVSELYREITQKELPGAGLWLRAEPDFDEAQALALARIVAETGKQPE